MSQPSIEHPEELLAWYVNGTLDGDERRQVEEHLGFCLACRGEVQRLENLRRAVKEADEPASPADGPPGEAGLERLLGALDGDEKPAENRSSRPFRPWWPLAVAAMLAVAVGVKVQRPWAPPVIERAGEDEMALRSAIPPGTALPRTACELRWEVAPEWQGARFVLRVTTTDLRPIVEVDDLDEPRYLVPSAALADLPASTRLLWRVEAVRPDGRRVSSPTFRVELEKL